MKYETRTSDYVCFEFGNKFKTPEQMKRNNVLTCFVGECGLCQEQKSVTHIRAFNYLRKPEQE